MKKKLNTAVTAAAMVLLFGLMIFGLLLIKNRLSQDDPSADSSAIAAVNADTVTASLTTAVTTAPITTTAEPTTEPPETEEDKIDEIISVMSLHEKVCQLFIVTPEGLTGGAESISAGEASRAAMSEYPVGGIICFEPNLISREQTTEMITNFDSYAAENTGIPLFITVDEEGGDVARCAHKLGTTAFSDMYFYRSEGAETAYANAKTIAADIAGLGFNLDLAPVADTWSNPVNTVIGTRAYSSDFSEAAQLVAEAVKGFSDGGVTCSLKHFPGHGDTAQDSHYSAAVTYKTAEQLEAGEYLAFRSGIDAGAEMIMVGHITVPAIDSEPSSVSRSIITGELRGKLGFSGVVITDSLSMGAVANFYGADELAVRVLEAGGDLLLTPTDLKTAVAGVEEAVANGRLTEGRIDESLRRILVVKLGE